MKKILLLIFILAVTFLSFISSLNNDFTNWDDNLLILNNPQIRSLNLESVTNIFTSIHHKGYIPLTMLSFALEYHFFQYNPFFYHLDNILLHLLVTALIFQFALQTGLPVRAAAFAALIFGVHPMHVESVAWITERKDMLYAVFYMLALCAYWQYLKSQKVIYYLAGIMLGILSMLAKPMALSLPLILFACDWLYGRRWGIKMIVEKSLHLTYIAPITMVTYALNERLPIQNIHDGVLIGVWTLTFYVKKFFLPFHLSPLYQLPEPVSLATPAYLSAGGVLLLSIFLIFYFRKNRWLSFSFLFYFLSIFFLLKYDNTDTSIVGDRYMYLPSLGFCFLIGYFMDRYGGEIKVKRAPVIFPFSCLIIALLGVKTFYQNNVWQDSISLWKAVIENNAAAPSAMAAARNNKYQQQLINAYLIDHTNTANAYAQQGKFDEALAEYKKALLISTDNALVFYNRGNVYLMQNKFDLAIADFSKAIEHDPNNLLAYTNRGGIYYLQNRFDLALRDFNKALEIDPAFKPALDNRARIYQIRDRHF
jgi:tetratricopeptide (TPR) repeat protein